MPFQCDRCGRAWDDEAAKLNAFRCYSGCGGVLKQEAGSGVDQAQPPSEHFAWLPSVLAIPYREYAAEKHAVMRLFRLCETVENLTRFLAILAFGELRRRLPSAKEPLSDELLALLQPRIERPTFGQWRDMLKGLNDILSRGDDLVLPELPAFVSKHLAPLMPGRDALEEECVVSLRNLLAHGGGMSRSRAAELLAVWEPRLDSLFSQLEFLRACDVHHWAGGQAHRIGMPGEIPEEVPLSAEFRLALSGSDDHVVLVRSQKCLDLWPLCQYGRATARTPAGSRPASADSPLVYFRANIDRLLYAALGVDIPFGERADVIDDFRSLFKLEDRQPGEPAATIDFEAEIRRDADDLVGRTNEIKRLKEAVKGTQQGVLWIAGPGGIGKSFLMARLADDLVHSPPERLCRIAWRFKVGDHARSNRSAFFRHAVARLADWPPLGKKDVVPAADPNQLDSQLRSLLRETARLAPPDPRGKAPRVVFVLDGLDEIARLDPDFLKVPFEMGWPNVVWICAGRHEQSLPQVFSPERTTHVFPEGLPAMSNADIRAMLVDGSGSLKYQLLPLDSEHKDAQGNMEVTNAAVQAVVDRAAGLPLYVHFVLADILSGHFRFPELPHRLPAGLSAYFDDLLGRLAIGDLQALLTPLVVTIAWSKAPLDEETLHLLMMRRKALPEEDAGRTLLRRGLEAIGSMLRRAPIPETQSRGYEPYHPTFRDHMRADEAGTLAHQNALAQAEFCALAEGWSTLPAGHAARLYALRFGPRSLIEAQRWKQVDALLTDLPFLEAKTTAGLVFELAQDFAAAVAAMPGDFEGRKNLRLLEEALRRDIQFIHRHREDYPQGLFQCLWNSCWWYDCPEAAAHYIEPKNGWPEPPPWEAKRGELCDLLAAWRAAKGGAWANRPWILSMRPPATQLGAGQQVVLRGHEHDVKSVDFSSDGRRIASGSDDKTVRVWDAETGSELRQLRGHEKSVEGVAFSPDGRRIVSGSYDKTVRVWDAETGAELRLLRGHEKFVTSVAFSPDGRRIATGSWDHTVRVWDAETGVELHEIRGDSWVVTSVAFSPDGRRIATGSWDHTVRVWDAETGAELRRLRGHTSSVLSVAFSPDGQRIVSGSCDHTVRVWDAEAGTELLQLHGHEGWVESVVFSADGLRIASGSVDKTVRVSDVEMGAGLRQFRGHELAVKSVAFSPDGRRIATASVDTTVRVWDAEAAVEAHPLAGHQGWVESVAFSSDGRRIATGSSDQTVRVWDAEMGTELLQLNGHSSNVLCVAFSLDGRRIASGSWDGTVAVWDAQTGTELHLLRGHQSPVTSVTFSPDGRRIASGAWDDTVRVWDAQTGAELQWLPGHGMDATSVAFSADGRRIAIRSRDKTVRVWHAGTRPRPMLRDAFLAICLGRFRREPVCLKVISGADKAETIANVTMAGGYRAVARGEETVIEDCATAEVVGRFLGRLHAIAIHPSGRLWAAGTASYLQLLRLENPNAAASLPRG